MAFVGARDDEHDDENVVRIVEKALAARNSPGMRPLPVFLNGREINLHSLLRAARSRGGYRRITRALAWGTVAAELGFASHMGPGIKLVYVKYLRALESGNVFKEPQPQETFRQRRKSQRTVAAASDNPANDAAASIEQARGAENGAAASIEQARGAGNGAAASIEQARGADAPSIEQARGADAPSIEQARGADAPSVQQARGADAPSVEQARRADAPGADAPSVEQARGADAPSIEQARRAVIWLRRLAVNPGDPLKAQGPPGSLEDKQWVDSCYKLVKSFRTRNNAQKRRRGQAKRQDVSAADFLGDMYQAVVPPFKAPATGSNDNNDRVQFLGTLVWGQAQNAVAEAAGRMGRVGSSSSLHKKCSCLDKKSVDCVRRHILEEKHQLRLELGNGIYARWGLDRMGETVGNTWTAEDVEKFKASFDYEDHWKQLNATFPHKTRSELVSFYFNVFVLRRRARQNRTNTEVDSDADSNS